MVPSYFNKISSGKAGERFCPMFVLKQTSKITLQPLNRFSPFIQGTCDLCRHDTRLLGFPKNYLPPRPPVNAPAPFPLISRLDVTPGDQSLTP